MMKREKGSKRGGSVQMRKWRKKRGWARYDEKGSKRRKCANEKMAGKEGSGRGLMKREVRVAEVCK